MVFGKTITWRMWIESMVCRRNSSGKYSPPGEDSKSNDRPYSVNLSTSKTGSSSCQCTTTLHGEKKEMQKDVNTIHIQTRNMLVNSLAVIGLSRGLDQKRNVTELALTNPTDPGPELQRIWWLTSQISAIQYFVPPVPLREENWEAKRGRKEVNTLQW